MKKKFLLITTALILASAMILSGCADPTSSGSSGSSGGTDGGETLTDGEKLIGLWGSEMGLIEITDGSNGTYAMTGFDGAAFTYVLDEEAGTIQFSSDSTDFMMTNEKNNTYGYALADDVLAVQYDSEIVYFIAMTPADEITEVPSGTFESELQSLTLNSDGTFEWIAKGTASFDLGAAESKITGEWTANEGDDTMSHSPWDVSFVIDTAQSIAQGDATNTYEDFSAEFSFEAAFDVFSDKVISFEGTYDNGMISGTLGLPDWDTLFADVEITDIIAPKAASADDLKGLWEVEGTDEQVYFYPNFLYSEYAPELEFMVETEEGFSTAELNIRTNDIQSGMMSYTFKSTGAGYYYLPEDTEELDPQYSTDAFSKWGKTFIAKIDGEQLYLTHEASEYDDEDTTFTLTLNLVDKEPAAGPDDVFFIQDILGTWSDGSGTSFTFNADGTYAATFDGNSVSGRADFYGSTLLRMVEISSREVTDYQDNVVLEGENIDVSYPTDDNPDLRLRIDYDWYDLTKE